MNRGAQEPRGALARRAGLACLLIAACARVVTTHDPLPGWGLDPVTTVAPFDGVGPAGDMLLSALALLGLGLVLFGGARARERVPWALLALGAVGLIPVAYHGWLGPSASVENARVGLVWAGSIAGGLAAAIACRHRAERGLALAACAAIVGPLVFRAAVQVYSEHPVMLEDFRERREEILASHGWSPDSAMARSYERRLAQPDASAWFAMSNVYASVLAGCAAAYLGGLVAAVRERLWHTGSRHDRYRMAGLGAGLALSVGGLLLAVPAGGAPSKGAVGAMLLGFALVALAMVRGRLPAPVAKLLRPEVIGLGVVGLALVAILARGLVGERLGELSLYFRWFYVQAAGRIIAEHPVWGVGPDGFQAAYLLAKNPLSPEEVSSPHSVLFEFVATLGVLGMAWCALVLAGAGGAGRSLLARDPETNPPGNRSARGVLWLLVVLGPCAVISFCAEGLPLARSVPDVFGVLILDAVVKVTAWSLLWLGLAAALLGVGGSPAAQAGLGAGALAVLAHSQIELTATDVGSAGWAFVVLGAAAAGPVREGRSGRGPVIVGALAAALAGAVLAAYVPIRDWQSTLREVSAGVGESTSLSQRLGALFDGRGEEEPRELISDLERAVGTPIAADPESASRALGELRIRRLHEAAERLAELARASHPPARAVAREAARLYGAEAAVRRELGQNGVPALRAAADLASWATERWPRDSRAWRDLAQVREALAGAGEGAPEGAMAPLVRAAELDPHSPDLAADVAFRLADLGRVEEARGWAERALASHGGMRLDPLAGLSDRQVTRLRELLGDP